MRASSVLVPAGWGQGLRHSLATAKTSHDGCCPQPWTHPRLLGTPLSPLSKHSYRSQQGTPGVGYLKKTTEMQQCYPHGGQPQASQHPRRRGARGSPQAQETQCLHTCTLLAAQPQSPQWTWATPVSHTQGSWQAPPPSLESPWPAQRQGCTPCTLLRGQALVPVTNGERDSRRSVLRPMLGTSPPHHLSSTWHHRPSILHLHPSQRPPDARLLQPHALPWHPRLCANLVLPKMEGRPFTLYCRP